MLYYKLNMEAVTFDIQTFKKQLFSVCGGDELCIDYIANKLILSSGDDQNMVCTTFTGGTCMCEIESDTNFCFNVPRKALDLIEHFDDGLVIFTKHDDDTINIEIKSELNVLIYTKSSYSYSEPSMYNFIENNKNTITVNKQYFDKTMMFIEKNKLETEEINISFKENNLYINPTKCISIRIEQKTTLDKQINFKLNFSKLKEFIKNNGCLSCSDYKLYIDNNQPLIFTIKTIYYETSLIMSPFER